MVLDSPPRFNTEFRKLVRSSRKNQPSVTFILTQVGRLTQNDPEQQSVAPRAQDLRPNTFSS